MIAIDKINFSKLDGLIPACIQHSETLQILMIGFMNKQALEMTIQTRKVTFWSRTKNRLWIKGETSGNYLEVVDLSLDCDNDSILIFVKPIGATCHTGAKSCFSDPKKNFIFILNKLTKIIEDRFNQPKSNSYTSKIFSQGIKRIAQKVGEEGLEVALAAVSDDKKALIAEIADLVFHLLVLLQQCEIKLNDVANILNDRIK